MHPILLKIPIPVWFQKFHPAVEIPVFLALVVVAFFLLRRARFLVGSLVETGFGLSVAAFLLSKLALVKIVPEWLSPRGYDATVWLLGLGVAFYIYVEIRRISKNSFLLNDLIFWGMWLLLGYGRSTIIEELPEPIPIHSYGLLVATGFIVGIGLATREARRIGAKAEEILDLSFWLIIAALVGSRVLFIIVNLNDYLKHPLNVLKIWQGGLVFYGGLLGAIIGGVIYVRNHKMNLFRTADILMPSVAIGHVFGRLGCFCAGCCFGKVTELWWGAHFPAGSLAYSTLREKGLVTGGFTPGLHPTQLYEACGELLIFFVLMIVRRYKHFNGQVFLSYLVLYPVMRSIVELFRGDIERGFVIPGVLSTSQFISIGVVAGAIYLIYYLRKKNS